MSLFTIISTLDWITNSRSNPLLQCPGNDSGQHPHNLGQLGEYYYFKVTDGNQGSNTIQLLNLSRSIILAQGLLIWTNKIQYTIYILYTVAQLPISHMWLNSVISIKKQPKRNISVGSIQQQAFIFPIPFPMSSFSCLEWRLFAFISTTSRRLAAGK